MLAMATWSKIAPRSEFARSRGACDSCARMARSSIASTRGWSVDNAAAALQLLAEVVGGRQKSTRHRRQRGYFVWLQRSNEPRRDQDEQLGPLLPIGLALEEAADDRQLAHDRHGRRVFLRL